MKKIFAIVTSLALILPASVGAVTAAELQVQIDALLATLADLQAQLKTLEGAAPIVTGCTITSFDRNLSQGMTGDDVKCLQITLNSAADTQVAASGAGSPGSETSYFGSLTKAAVVKFQDKYASEVLASWGLTSGTGYVGSTTRAKLNSLLGAVPPGCDCTAWIAGSCVGTDRQYTRTCTPATCAAETKSETDATCVTAAAAGLTVALAADTPASATVVDNQSVAPLAKFTFTNGDSTEVKITQLKLKRIGVSEDTDLDNVYLFEGATRLTDAASVSSGVITMSDSAGIIKVAAGASKTITVAVDIHNAISGKTVGVSIEAATDVTSNASALNGSFPLKGNLMSVADGTLATMDFNTTTTPSSNATIVPQNDYAVWQNIATVGTRAVNMTRISLREIGSIKYADLQNFRLYIDGVQIGSAIQNLDDNGYVTFDLSADPKKIETGARTIKVLADIINGSNRTFSFSLRVAADANFVDTQYGVNVRPTANSATFTARTTGTITVGTGTLTVQKTSDSPSGNIINNAANATLAKYTLTAAGENVKIETLYVSVAVVDTSDANKGGTTAATQIGYLRNGALYANGIQIGSTSNLYENSYSTTYTTFNLGSSLIVEPGSPVTLEVRADIYDNDGTNSIVATDKITATIEGSTDWNNAQGMNSLETIDVPADDKAGNQVTVKAGSLTLAKYTAYTNQSMTDPLTNAKLAHFTLTADTTEAVNLSSISLDIDNVAGDFTYADLTNLYVKYGTNETTKKATLSAATSNSWSINYVLSAGQTLDVIVYADVGSSAYISQTSTGRVDMTVTGTTASSAANADTSEVTGQTISFTTSSITSAVDAGTPDNQAVAGNQQVTAGKFKFTTVNDDYSIKEVKVKVGSAAISAVIKNAILKDGSTVLGTKPLDTATNTTAYFTGLNIAVPANTTKVLTVDLDLSIPSTDYSTSQKNTQVTLDWFKAYDSQGAVTNDDNDRAANNLYVYRSLPTFSMVPLSSTEQTTQGLNLTAGSSTTLYKFKVGASDKGQIDLKQLKFAVTITENSTSNNATLTLNTYKLFRGTSDITSLVVIQNTGGTSLESTTTSSVEGANTVIVTFGASGTSEESIGAGVTYEYTLKATPSGFVTETAGSDSVSTYLNGDDNISSDSSLFYVYNSGTGSIHQLATAAAGTGATAENVIWSDHSAISHSVTSGSSTADWINSISTYLNLPLDPQGIVAK